MHLAALPLIGALLLTGAAAASAQDGAPDAKPADATAKAAPSIPPHKPILKRLFSMQALTATVPGAILTDTVTARKPDGRRTVALSTPANAYGSWAIATLWSPREFRNAESIFEWGTAGMGVSAGTNLAREFWPDLKGIFHKKK